MPNESELLPCPEYERWFFTARSPDKDMPWGTHLIYQVCDNDEKKFEIAEKILQEAFKAGMAVSTRPAPAQSVNGELLVGAKMVLESHDRTCKGEECQISGIDILRAAIARAEGRG